MRVCIFTDSKSSLQAISSYRPTHYFYYIHSIQQLLQGLKKEICFQWIPGHIDIMGNERADELAKLAASMEPKPQKVEILTSSINYIKQTYKDVWTHECKTSSVARKLYEIQQTPSDLEMYKNTNRQIQTFISRARTGHIITEHYLH